jgi:preprotein translocase subunit SecG
MEIVKIVLTVIQVLAAIFLTADVLLQSGKSAACRAPLPRRAETFYPNNNSKRWDYILAKITKNWHRFMVTTPLVLCLAL